MKPPRLGAGVRAVPRLFSEYPGICLSTEENHGKPQSGNRLALGNSVPKAIRLRDLAIAGDCFDWPAGPCRTWFSRQATDSNYGILKYLPSFEGSKARNVAFFFFTEFSLFDLTCYWLVGRFGRRV